MIYICTYNALYAQKSTLLATISTLYARNQHSCMAGGDSGDQSVKRGGCGTAAVRSDYGGADGGRASEVERVVAPSCIRASGGGMGRG